MMRPWRWLVETILSNPYTRSLLIFASLAGIVFGFYYYYDQLISSPLWQWPFIPDSPIAVLLYALALALISIRRRSNKLDSIAFILMTKIGIWTTVVLLVYWDYYFTQSTLALRSFILATHVLMVAMAALLLPAMKKEQLWFYPTLLAVLIALDWIDYALDTHPWLPDKHIAEIGWLTASLSVFLVLFVVLWQLRWDRGQTGPPR